jgi:hypothetical protein
MLKDPRRRAINLPGSGTNGEAWGLQSSRVEGSGASQSDKQESFWRGKPGRTGNE